MSETVPPDSEQNLDAPPKLVIALEGAARREIFVPHTVDCAILAAAQAQLKPAPKPAPFAWPRWVLWPAFVTACIVAVLIVRLTTTHEQTQFSREDLNHDGKVDILDSFALAREMKNGQPLPKAFDVNGDGVVDERDANQIAAHAVSLGKESRS